MAIVSSIGTGVMARQTLDYKSFSAEKGEKKLIRGIYLKVLGPPIFPALKTYIPCMVFLGPHMISLVMPTASAD